MKSSDCKSANATTRQKNPIVLSGNQSEEEKNTMNWTKIDQKKNVTTECTENVTSNDVWLCVRHLSPHFSSIQLFSWRCKIIKEKICIIKIFTYLNTMITIHATTIKKLAIKMKCFDPTKCHIWWIINGAIAAAKAITENIRHFSGGVN